MSPVTEFAIDLLEFLARLAAKSLLGCALTFLASRPKAMLQD
jgi:hypothetical protein